ncbi:MAG: adenylate/guanylate cyclase domain-containing protein [Spirochaetes bacterium]|nr:adenylate/guanylate cyclase domain-containing protein [Spirochaetota bacterium]
MKLSRYAARRLQLLAIPALAGTLIGPAVAAFISPKPTPYTALQGVICGLAIGVTVFYLEYFILDRIRKFSIGIIIVSRTLIYSLVIVASYILSNVIVFPLDTLLYDIRNYLAPTFVAAVVSILTIMLFINVNRLLGQKVFIRLLVGLYHRPVTERRIFMFLDLASSTALAEEMGDRAFHSFLNDFFFDATRPIVECKGEIYKYVGDEIIVTWTMKNGIKKGNCIECFFLIEEAVARMADRYRGKYGSVPRFTAGVHCGEAVIGEMGDYKREVAFLGDAVNTTARIQSECRHRERGLIVSGDLRDELAGRGLEGYAFENLGAMVLRGKKREVELCSVTRG